MHSGSIHGESHEAACYRLLKRGWCSNHDLIAATGCTYPATVRPSIVRQLPPGERMERKMVRPSKLVRPYNVYRITRQRGQTSPLRFKGVGA